MLRIITRNALPPPKGVASGGFGQAQFLDQRLLAREVKVSCANFLYADVLMYMGTMS